MNIRPFSPFDIPALKAIYERQGFPYIFPDLNKMEAVLVVTDENGEPVAAIAAEKLVQLYLFVGTMEHPATALAIIRLMHAELSKVLKSKGYSSAEAFLPPSIARRFGRRLERTFGWVRNWPSWTKGF